MEKICVAVRVRPPVSPASDDASFASPDATGIHWKLEDNHISLHRSHGTPISGLPYTFDHVFDEISTNSQVYALLTKDIIHAAVDGFNGTAFAYGQTSSGKTYTMNGSQSDPGIIHRAVKDVFNLIDSMRDREFLIRVSYMEIYNEEINDLFAVKNQKLPIHESLDRGIFVAGLREEIVNNAEQVLKLIESGEVNRHFGETNMNARSSRSHTIFRMVIESKGKDSSCSDDYSIGDAIRVSVLNLVDLAGSERIAKTGARGVRLKEGKHINKSLMVLGNVINKLSEGPKQRGHIPYRDSKLTRILQPALGGNAKTSIICTVAPEEIHVEETKGTLQFASRAKRITNCAQVNEILSDAALLKRQKLEIEELRKKLEGSRAEVLEQEVLKLRNEMLTYELDREKLEMQLEEERKSHLERDQCIREQRMNTNNLSDLVINSNSDKNSSQGSGLQRGREEFNDSNSFSQGDIFKTPCLKAAPNSFVGKRSAYSRLPDCSPLPDNFSNVADEDTWLQMNKGYVADLDSIQMTPARKVQSFPPSDVTTEYPSEKDKHEVHNLKGQLDVVIKEKKELEKNHSEQLLLNDHLMREISKHKRETLTIQEIPQSLRESVACYKDIYEDIFLTLQSSVPNQESPTAKLLACTIEICTTLFVNLESDISMAMDGHKPSQMDHSTAREKCEEHSKKLKDAITSLVSSETSPTHHQEKLSGELATIKEKYHELEKELNLTRQQLEVSTERYSGMERDLHLLKDERDSLLEKVSESSGKLLMVTEQKENVLKDLNTEARRRKDLEDDIKQLSVAFGKRQNSSMLLHREIKSKIENMRSPNPVSLLL